MTSGPALGNLLSQASAPLHVTGIGGPAMTTWNMGSGLYKFPGRFFCFSLYFIMSNYYKNNMKHSHFVKRQRESRESREARDGTARRGGEG